MALLPYLPMTDSRSSYREETKVANKGKTERSTQETLSHIN